MADKPENPPVFPRMLKHGDKALSEGGMSLRDYFAATLSFDPECLNVPTAEALMGEKSPVYSPENWEERLYWWLGAEAKYRYARADAMLRERGK